MLCTYMWMYVVHQNAAEMTSVSVLDRERMMTWWGPSVWQMAIHSSVLQQACEKYCAPERDFMSHHVKWAILFIDLVFQVLEDFNTCFATMCVIAYVYVARGDRKLEPLKTPRNLLVCSYSSLVFYALIWILFSGHGFILKFLRPNLIPYLHLSRPMLCNSCDILPKCLLDTLDVRPVPGTVSATSVRLYSSLSLINNHGRKKRHITQDTVPNYSNQRLVYVADACEKKIAFKPQIVFLVHRCICR